MPFYFGSPYAPAAFWRYLEAYTSAWYQDTIGAGALQWRNIVNYVGRGVLMSVSSWVNPAVNFRMSVDGGAWILFTLENGEMIPTMTGFATSINVQHQRKVITGVLGKCWVLQE